MRHLCSALVLATLAGLVACAPTRVRVRIPEGEDYLYPVGRPGELTPEEARRAEEAWRSVLAGDAAAAEQAYGRLLARRPGSLSLATGLAYARLRAGRLEDAARSFDGVLALQGDYVPALVGGGSVALRRGDPETALELFRRAQAFAPQETLVRRRLAELKIHVTEKCVAEARDAQEKGDLERAVGAYRRALEAAPEVAEIRLELANLLASGGDAPGAIAVLQEDPGRDRQVLLRLGELLMAQKELDKALEAYHELVTRDPKDAEGQSRSAEVRKALEFQGMPEEYRKIYDSPRVSRADLAALISVKARALQRLKAGEPQVAVDISGSWAREHILRVLSFNIMEVYPNHTFQPGATVRRGDLAEAVSRVLELLHYPRAASAQATDVSPHNVLYEGVNRTVAAGLMDLSPTGAFEAWRPVTGRDAADVVEGLVRLVGP
jgi:tetratricopeptide (TPR) repeat protein